MVGWAGKAIIVAGATVVGSAVAPVVAPAAVGLVGFGPIGPVAGSLAAAWQAGMGGVVAAGGWFAGAQATAMGGAMPVIGNVIAGGITGGATLLGLKGRR
ncbi:hypothetical protein EIP91_004430 [Steccherinum ochraceum]|uniref:Uncharacterized protein n=1 Tax=Steccherinum ochraceum TaxID=92696 RepID=A0A4V2MW08_9APHY|nr:hypothetical protein EIP91_004430 [Steccherinum ochraceum]